MRLILIFLFLTQVCKLIAQPIQKGGWTSGGIVTNGSKFNKDNFKTNYSFSTGFVFKTKNAKLFICPEIGMEIFRTKKERNDLNIPSIKILSRYYFSNAKNIIENKKLQLNFIAGIGYGFISHNSNRLNLLGIPRKQTSPLFNGGLGITINKRIDIALIYQNATIRNPTYSINGFIVRLSVCEF